MFYVFLFLFLLLLLLDLASRPSPRFVFFFSLLAGCIGFVVIVGCFFVGIFYGYVVFCISQF